MGYNPDESMRAAEDNTLKNNEKQAALDNKNAVTMSKDEQDALLLKVKAYAQREPEISAQGIDFSKPIDDQSNENQQNDPNKELMRFPTSCYACTAEGEVRMCIATIPYFKEIIIMAFSCD